MYEPLLHSDANIGTHGCHKLTGEKYCIERNKKEKKKIIVLFVGKE